MVSLKKTALAVIALGVSGVASAAMYTPPPAPVCKAAGVTVPCEKNAWDLGIQALYVQANSVNDVTNTSVSATSTSDTSFQDVKPDFEWGIYLEGSYHFGTGNDINVNWTHFSGKTEDTTNDASVVGQYLPNPVDGTDTVVTSVDNDFDAINFEFGQTVNVGERVDARFHGGLQYMSVDQTIDQNGYVAGAAETADDMNIDRKFSGIGPRFGLDTSYSFPALGNGAHFSLVAESAVSILVGDSKYNSTETQTNAGNVTQTDTVSSTERNIVPGAEGKLGVRYTHPLNGHGNSMMDKGGELQLEGGYQVVNYWSPLKTNPAGADNLADDFGYQGVYFGLKWIGNA